MKQYTMEELYGREFYIPINKKNPKQKYLIIKHGDSHCRISSNGITGEPYANSDILHYVNVEKIWVIDNLHNIIKNI